MKLDITTINKLKYLVASDGDREVTRKFIRISSFTLNNLLTDTVRLSPEIDRKIKKAFKDRLYDDVLFKIEKDYKPLDMSQVKNYDLDETLTDLKTWNSSHGVNKGHGASRGHSNRI